MTDRSEDVSEIDRQMAELPPLPTNEAEFTKWVGAESFPEAVRATIRSSMENGHQAQKMFDQVKSLSSRADDLDMALDEFLRIKALCGNHISNAFFDEIAGLCDRAALRIKQNTPVIVQRDEWERKAVLYKAALLEIADYPSRPIWSDDRDDAAGDMVRIAEEATKA